MNNTLRNVLVGVGIAGGVVAGASLLPMALGFGTAGIAAGSTAAAIQSGIGNVAAGSLFSIMQSLGMTGFFAKLATVAGVAAAGAAAGAGATGSRRW